MRTRGKFCVTKHWPPDIFKEFKKKVLDALPLQKKIVRIAKRLTFFHLKHTSFKPTFTFTQVEAFRTVGAYVSPTTLITIWTLHTYGKVLIY